MSGNSELDALRARAESLAARADELRRSLDGGRVERSDESERSPLRLAHYTSLQAVVSMLQDPHGGLRLSDSATMNDPDEGEATTDDRMFLKLLTDESTAQWLRTRYRSAYLCCFVGILGKRTQPIDPGDDLLYWRLYGGDCRGVSITVPSHYARTLVESSVVRRVIYTDESRFGNDLDLTSMAEIFRDLDDLRSRALAADWWRQVCWDVLPSCDQLFAQRFLHKRSHYSMENEYRAVVFDVDDDPVEPNRSLVACRGMHVQFGLCRRFVQVPQLSCEAFLTTNTQITIGSNVSEPKEAQRAIEILLREREMTPNVVPIRISNMRYRPR